MTPAIELAKQRGLDFKLHEYHHDPKVASYGLEAAAKLAVNPSQIFKTLVVVTDTGTLAVAIIPVNSSLNFKKMAKALRCKKVQMADPKQVERTTGYVLGGVSPLGQKKPLASMIDNSAQTQRTIYVSAGRRGLEIQLPTDQLAETIQAAMAELTD